MSPTVSVIIPVYKCEQYIAYAIQSVLDQTFQDFEIIIVNDGSPDKSKLELLPYLSDQRIKYVEQNNQGAASARNLGLSLASGELVALLDCDDIWLPNKLELQVKYMDSHTGSVLVHGRAGCIDSAGRVIAPPHVSWQSGDWQERYCGNIFRRLFVENGIVPTTVMIRKCIFDAIEPFRQRYFPADDYDLWLRASRLGCVGLLDETVALYRWHGGNFSSNWLEVDITTAQVLESVLEDNPLILTEIPRSIIKSRFHALYHTIAQEYSRRNEWNTAKTYWVKAIINQPACIQCYCMYAMGLIPKGLRSRLRWWLHKLNNYTRG